MAEGPTAERQFRSEASYAAEKRTRDMLAGFLKARGFRDVEDIRKTYGKSNAQLLRAKKPDAMPVAMRVRLCWRRDGRNEREKAYSAAQLLPEVKGDDWEATLKSKVAREVSDGVTHFLFVQSAGEKIAYAALVPVDALVPIWCGQRDCSAELIERGLLGKQRKNHAENGSSPAIWLQDDRTESAHAVAAVLWDNPQVDDLARWPMTGDDGATGAGSETDDSFDDLRLPAYATIGNDGAAVVRALRSYVKRSEGVRSAVIKRAKGKCENANCGLARLYPGFLDVHHVLGAQKSDRFWNCVALCPNCHRDAHVSPDSEAFNASLLAFASAFKPSSH